MKILSKICIVTATRAEYGLLKPVISGLIDKKNDVRIVVSGAHLSEKYGLTYKEIEKDGFEIDAKIDMKLNSDTPSQISNSMANAIVGFANYFQKRRPDCVVILGDRYEMLSVAITAMNERIPIIHLYGGDVTEGAIDDMVRNSLTKMSLYHFVGTEEHRRRVIQMGEDPQRVWTVGTLSAANAIAVKKIPKKEIEKQIGFCWEKETDKIAIITYHPVTLESENVSEQVKILLRTLDRFPELKCIFTGANADCEGEKINELLKEYVKYNPQKAVFIESLGQVRYLSALSLSDVVIGNSSSGLSEAPSFHVPTVNIGNRQKGRTAGETVISCGLSENEIASAIKKALSEEFRISIKNAVNPYYKEGTVKALVEGINNIMLKGIKSTKKTFYNI